VSKWRPKASTDTLIMRAKLIQKIRVFFQERQYLEVETPQLAHHGVTDIYLNNLEVTTSRHTYYLQTSPEYHMKRLLANGSGPIFQIAKAYRADEHGSLHNPEFTMLEWYSPGVDLHQLMIEVETLLQLILKSKKAIKMTYCQLFETYLGLNPHETSVEELTQCCNQFNLGGVLSKNEQDKDSYLFLLLSSVIEPELVKLEMPVFIYDFPKSQASLATIKDGVALRFELYFKGIELANGFHELTCPKTQLQRFLQDCLKRCEYGLTKKAIDGYLIDALKAGLPKCSGVALGVDRLIMLALNKQSIQQVMSFSIENA
jgi:elongation factor P--(R)-beta-lysine ligase